ncbi:MAG: 4Fe-4S dicluster domain-containing protein [Desulfovibrionaceae bacterium]
MSNTIKTHAPAPTPPRNDAMSRRAFLGALGLGGAALALPGAALAAQSAPSRGQAEELVTVLDLSRCIGCGACVEACHEANGHKFPEPHKPFPRMYPPRVKAEDWSAARDVDDRLTPYNWLYIQSCEVEHAGETHAINIPRRCLHCVNPPCADLCPWGAARKEATGIVRIDADICLGGAKCRTVCPWHIPQRQTGVGLYLDILPSLAGNGVMYKCDRCHDRLAQGGVPACIEACPNEVQAIGPRSAMVAHAHALAKDMNGYLYGETENGGTNTIYVSPVPFEAMDAALAKAKDLGPGKPGLAPVPHMLATEEKLAKAVFVAPFAGLVAGVLKAVRSASRDAQAARQAAAPEDRHDA